MIDFVRSGFGLGLMINIAMVNFNQYFKNRRTFVMSLTQTFIGICVMLYPIVVSILMEKFGFRGSVAIVAAINAHTIIGMFAMHPVEWHYKSIEVPVCETESCKFLGFCIVFSNGNQIFFCVVISLQ